MHSKTQYEYIRFVLIPTEGHPRKTDIYSCQNIRLGNALGSVQWSSAWRQYAYFPFMHTAYSAEHLTDIADFIGQLMAERK